MSGTKRQRVLGGALAAALAVAAGPTEARFDASLLVSGQELAGHPDGAGVRILDARPAERYAAGHIPGAANLPVAAITRTIDGVPGMLAPIGEVERLLGERGVTRESRVVVYDDIGGDQATRLFWALDALGHPRAHVLQGGFRAWKREGRPVARGAPTPASARYRSVPRPDRLADTAWVKAHLGDPGVQLLDARSPEEFEGTVAGKGVARAGRIPGAVNVDWVHNLTATEPRRFRDAAELARLYREAGVAQDREIVVYCRTGARASHAYFVLRLLGYPRVRLYDGSFVEWAADPGVPVAHAGDPAAPSAGPLVARRRPGSGSRRR